MVEASQEHIIPPKIIESQYSQNEALTHMTSYNAPKKLTAKLVSSHKGKPSKLSRKNTTTERMINGKKRRQSNTNTTTTTTKSPHIKLKKKPAKSEGNIEPNLVDQHGLWRRLSGFHFHLRLCSAALE
jgi:hypothetical protein